MRASLVLPRLCCHALRARLWLLRRALCLGVAAVSFVPAWLGAAPGDELAPGPVYQLPVADLRAEAEALAPVLALSPADVERWNPALADFCHVGCPTCGEGRACGSGVLSWVASRPFEIRCAHCREVFPSVRFPLRSETKVMAPDGSVQRYGFYSSPDGWPYYLDSLALNRRREWLRRMARRLGAMYHATGEVPYAAQARVILLSFARIYDSLPVHGFEGLDSRPVFFPVSPETEPENGVRPIRGPLFEEEGSAEEPYPKWSVRQGAHWYYREIPSELVLAYDQIKPVLTLSERELIERFLRKTVNFTRAFRFRQDNMSGLLAQHEIQAGRVIGEPEFVRAGVKRLEAVVQSRYFADGTWYETAPSYFQQAYRSLAKSIEALACKPVGAAEAGGAGGMDTLAFFPGQDLRRVEQSLAALRKPGGGLATLYDTWSGDSIPAGLPRTADVPSTLLWASGHAVLTHSGAEDPIQARLNFAGKQGSHYHLDNLGLQLYALGREPFSDFGYTQSRMRPYVRTTLAHNTVVVDDRPQSVSQRNSVGGRVEVFDTGGLPAFASASSPDSYPQTRVYRRSLSLIPAGDTAYLVDWFDVAGGRTHEWFLHGDADRDEAVAVVDSLPPVEGLALSDGKPFKLWDCGAGSGSWEAALEDHRMARRLLRQDARYRLAGEPARVAFAPVAGGCGRVVSTVLSVPGTELILGAMPSIRRAHEVNEAMRKFETPLVVLRRQAWNGRLESRFAAVHQVLADGSEPLKVGGDASMITVAAAGFTDYHFLGNWRGEGRERFEGRYGFVRTGRDGRVLAASLIDGTCLVAGGCDIALPAAETGLVLGVHGKTILLDRAVNLAPASRLYLDLPDGESYAMELAAQASASREVILCAAPGFDYADQRGKFRCFPGKEIRGAIRFAVRYSAHQGSKLPAKTPGGRAVAAAY